jgi:hypothetical protein
MHFPAKVSGEKDGFCALVKQTRRLGEKGHQRLRPLLPARRERVLVVVERFLTMAQQDNALGLSEDSRGGESEQEGQASWFQEPGN